MKRGRIFLLQSAVLLLGLGPRVARAQSLYDGDTLPRNTGGVIVSPGLGYGNGVLERFGRGWQAGRESILQDFDGLDLSYVLGGNEQQARTIETVVGGHLGITNFSANQTSVAINFTAAYGITDRLTVAVIAPFQYVRYDLDAYLEDRPGDVGFSDLRVNDDPGAIRCPGGEFDFDDGDDLLRLGNRQDGYRFNIGDLERAVTSECLGYEPVFDDVVLGEDGKLHGKQSRTVAGFRDVAFGAKYQLFRGRHVRLAALGYLVAATGRPVDPNKLIDFKLGDGNWSTGLLVGATVPLGRLTIGLSVGYEVELPDKERIRLPDIAFSDALETALAEGRITERDLFDHAVDEGQIQPIVTRYDIAEVDRKLGNNVYVYGMATFRIFEWLYLGATFNFLHHFRDRIDEINAREGGAPDYPTEAQVRANVQQQIEAGVIDEADRIETLKARLRGTVERKKAAYSWRTVRGQLGIGLGLNFNTLPMFARDEFPIPIIASIGVNRFVAGQNIDTPDSVTVSLTLPFAFGEVKDPASWGYDDEGEGPPWP